MLFFLSGFCVDCFDAFASRLAPTGDFILNVGASLLANGFSAYLATLPSTRRRLTPPSGNTFRRM
ncbi:hypothetical protein C0J26_19220 [Pseudomonas baetica]|nr:hypothetical protein C0J26_19220 [Pseudomonas baetica]